MATPAGRSTPSTARLRCGPSAGWTRPCRTGPAASSEEAGLCRHPHGTKLSLATRHRKKARRPTVPVSFPVFYDKSGKRLRRLVLAVCALACVVAGVLTWFIPEALTSVRGVDSDSGFAQRVLEGEPNLPLIGDGVLTRLVKVEREHNGSGNPPGPPPAGPYVG